MKKIISVNRIEANRMNARKSTGPKSAKGKAVSRMNGLKHGILAREVVLRGKVDGERGREFQALQRLYWEHLAPVGPLEEMLVERIVTAYWRLHRVLIAERGEILYSLEKDRERREMMNTSQLLPAVIGGRVLRTPWTYSTAGAIEDARDCVRRGEELTEPLLGRLLKALEDRPGMVSDLQKVREFVPDNSKGLSAEAVRAKRQQHLLEFLNELLECCEHGLRDIAESEAEKVKVRRDASLMPAQKIVDKLLRYEARLERQMYRAMNQLERLQRLRRGEVVPPPVAIQAS
ncbi:MAG: hypothetical protein ABSH14_16925 [Verrucomicrobiia bacterium]|jgi:hypothetical protein